MKNIKIETSKEGWKGEVKIFTKHVIFCTGEELYFTTLSDPFWFRQTWTSLDVMGRLESDGTRARASCFANKSILPEAAKAESHTEESFNSTVGWVVFPPFARARYQLPVTLESDEMDAFALKVPNAKNPKKFEKYLHLNRWLTR